MKMIQQLSGHNNEMKADFYAPDFEGSCLPLRVEGTNITEAKTTNIYA